MRSEELHSLKQNNIKQHESCFMFEFLSVKHRGEIQLTKILVPLNLVNVEICFATKIQAYLNATNESAMKMSTNLPLTKLPLTTKFRKYICVNIFIFYV